MEWLSIMFSQILDPQLPKMLTKYLYGDSFKYALHITFNSSIQKAKVSALLLYIK